MYPGKGMDNDLCMVVRAGNRIFLRGQTGFDLDGNMTGVGDPTAQAEMAMKCVKTLLEDAGSKLEHICKTTIYITDRAYLLFEGNILKQGTAEELAEDEQVRKVYLGENFQLRK